MLLNKTKNKKRYPRMKLFGKLSYSDDRDRYLLCG